MAWIPLTAMARKSGKMEKWSKLDKQLIKFVSRHPVIYDKNERCSNSGPANERMLDQLWNDYGKEIGSLGHSLKTRWNIIKSRYIYCYTNNVNRNSKYFDGSLDFLNPVIENMDCVVKNSEKCQRIDKKQKDDKHPVPEADFESDISSKMSLFKPGTLVSGEILDLNTEEVAVPETEALRLYESNISAEEDDLDDAFSNVDVDQSLAQILEQENNVSGNESITLYKTDDDNMMAAENFIIPDIIPQKDITTNDDDIPLPTINTRNFFKKVGLYVEKKFPDEKQKGIRMEIWSLVTAAEIELLDEDKTPKTSLLSELLTKKDFQYRG